MLRALLLLALGANALLWAHGQGWLAAVGWPLADQREPARWSQQVAPEGLRLLNGSQAAMPATGPSGSGTDAAAPAAEDDPRPAADAPPATER